MKRTRSGKAWMREHVNDVWVQRARQAGWRSRAVFKLIEIDQRDMLFAPGQVVVDLGAAPGSWSQYVVQRVMPEGRVFALDLLPIEAMPGVMVIEGDFQQDAPLAALCEALQGRKVDLVLSDMAPNISGIGVSDQARAVALAELALEFACQHLAVDGKFLLKVFQGQGYDDLRTAVQNCFRQTLTRKPKASRERSAELYLLASGLRVAKTSS